MLPLLAKLAADFSWLPFATFDRPNDLPNSAGIYIITSPSDVLYIGQSRNLRVRVRTHSRSGKFPTASKVY